MVDERKAGNSISELVSPKNPEYSTIDDIWRGTGMQFSNGDVSLDRAVERNGGHIVVANMNLLFDASF